MAPEPTEVVTAVDTNVVVAGLLSWHAHHKIASEQLIALLESKIEIVIPLPVLVEAYSVMTRMPPPHRLGAKEALEILEGSLRHRVSLVGLEGDEGWELLQDISQRSITGGTTFDGLILACARKGGAQQLVTFNRSHFERIAPEEIDIVVPGSTETQS